MTGGGRLALKTQWTESAAGRLRRFDPTDRGKVSGSRMIGIVIVTHGRLATEFRAAVEHIVGAQDAIETVPIGPDDDMERRRGDVLKAVAAADRGAGVIILTDMFGGTPCNLAISVMEAGRVEVIAGLNLPMLIKLVRIRPEAALSDAVAAAADAGRKYVSVASQVLAGA